MACRWLFHLIGKNTDSVSTITRLFDSKGLPFLSQLPEWYHAYTLYFSG